MFFKGVLKVFLAKTFIFGFPNACNPFQSYFFDHKIHAEYIPYSYMSLKHDFQQLIFSRFFWTTDWGKQEIYNSRYLACLPPLSPYIHTICSLWSIKPTKVNHSTIYTTSKHAFSPKKIVNLWTHNKS